MKGKPVIRGGFPFSDDKSEALAVSGCGAYLYDSNGRRYADLCSGLWNMPFGYSNPYLISRIKEQLDKLPFSNLLGMVADIQKEYAIRLTGYMGNFTSVLYTCSGSEAIEAAIKACRKYQALKGYIHRKTISAFALSYHGTSYGAMSISGIDRSISEDYNPGLPQIQWIDIPEDIYDIGKWIEIIDYHFREYGSLMAGLIIEPVFASGGIVIVPEEVMRHLQKLCNKNDILLVLDEIATGFGRTGVPFAFQRYNLQPDLVCLSKAINNGYIPLGALVFSDMLSGIYADKHAVIEHFSTQGGNLAAVSAALAMLDLMQEYEHYNVAYKGSLFLDILKRELSDKEKISVRGIGLMIAVDFPANTSGQEMMDIISTFHKRGILVYMYNNPQYNCGISIFPPFIMTGEEIERYAHMIVINLRRFF